MSIEVMIRRLHAIPASGTAAPPELVFALKSHAASLGFSLEGEITTGVVDTFSQWSPALQKMKGAHVRHAPLFSNFPNHSQKPVIVTIQNLLGMAPAGWWLSLFTLVQGLVDPAQHPFRDMAGLEEALRRESQRPLAATTQVKLVPISLLSPEDFRARQVEYVRNQFYGSSALQKDITEDLRHFPWDLVNPSQVKIRENIAVLASFQPRMSAAYAMFQSSTDVLRYLALRTGSDVSLKEKIRFPKLSNAERRMIMETLSGDHNLEENLLKYEGLWKALSRGLHPHEYTSRYPVAAAALDDLYKGNLRSWFSKMESLFLTPAVLSHVSTRPTVFARSLERFLQYHGESAAVAFAAVADKVPTKILQVLRSHLLRPALPKRLVTLKSGRVKVLDAAPSPDDALVLKVVQSIDSALEAQAQEMERVTPFFSGKKVWVDPSCMGVIAPYWQRAASDGLHVVPRGSRMPLPNTSVIRLFVYWKGYVDLDLSAVQEYGDGRLVDVAYYRLSDSGITHSGDIQSAPNGASEFIDVDLETLRKKGVRRLYMQVYRFTGRGSETEYFGNTEECFAGFMGVDNLAARTYDPKTVENVLWLKSKATYAVPLVLDLETNQIVYLDHFAGSGFSTNAYRKDNSVKEVVDLILDSNLYRPVIDAVADDMLRYRGAIFVDTADSADIILTTSKSNAENSAAQVLNVLDPGEFSKYLG